MTLWTSPKVAAVLASEGGLTRVARQRGWEALKAIGWSGQKRRPRHPQTATPEDKAALEKAGRGSRGGSGPAPGQGSPGLGRGRTPHRPEADHPTGVGAQRRAPDCAWPSPVRVAAAKMSARASR